jgi:hypothetical protein
MTTFDERERAFEAKFAHDEEMQFRAEALQTRLFAGWAAGLLGKTGAEAEAYVREILHADLERQGHEEIWHRVSADLDGLADAATIGAKLADLMRLARVHLLDQG